MTEINNIQIWWITIFVAQICYTNKTNKVQIWTMPVTLICVMKKIMMLQICRVKTVIQNRLTGW